MLFLGNVSETPTPTTCLKSTAVHLQFVRQYAPHLYRRALLAFKLREGNPAPFVLRYASHLYSSTPPICTAVLLEKYWGWGHRSVSEFSLSASKQRLKTCHVTREPEGPKPRKIQSIRNQDKGVSAKGSLQNAVSRPRQQKIPKDIGPSSSFGTQSATAKRGVHLSRFVQRSLLNKTFPGS